MTNNEIKKETVKDTYKDTDKDTIKDTVKDTDKDTIKDTYKDTVKDTIKSINLIIGGGSVKGVAYTGALEYLYKNNLLNNIKKFYGTSVGSIVGVFYCSGLEPFKILKILLSLNFENLWDFSFENIEKRYSIISDLFFNKIREIYSEFENPKITFKQFYEKYNIDLNFYATSLTTRKNTCFNKDTYPNVEILTAVQASSSIPLIFPPVIINEEYFIDGCMKCLDGVCSNIINSNNKDINYIIKSDYENKNINSFMDYLSEVINCTLQNENCINNEYTVNISFSENYKAKLNFNDLDNSSKLHLYYEGFKQCRNKIKPLIIQNEKEKLEKEKLEKQEKQEKLEKLEKQEKQEKQEKLEKLEKQEKQEKQEKLEKERLEKEKLERLEKERLEKERLEKERLEKENIEKVIE
jgi:hypothetical protein